MVIAFYFLLHFITPKCSLFVGLFKLADFDIFTRLIWSLSKFNPQSGKLSG